jgi:hypothetical protein
VTPARSAGVGGRKRRVSFFFPSPFSLITDLSLPSPPPIIQQDDDAAAADGWAHEARAGPRPEAVPVREVALALGLLAAGCAFAVLARLAHAGRLDGHVHDGAAAGFGVLATLTFLPGAYATRIAYCVARGRPGYSWADLPRSH